MMNPDQNKLRYGFHSGIQKGWRGFVWMLKIIVPISFLTVLLEYSGWIDKIDFILKPAMNLLNLPPMAALPLIVGMLTGIYGGIASMVVLPLTNTEMTLIAIFLLISHNLIQEGIIQGQSGLNPLKATLFRLTASCITVVIVARFLGSEPVHLVEKNLSVAMHQPLFIMMKGWFMATLYLSLKIFVIIMVIMILLELMKVFNIIHHIVKVLNPLLKTMGLNRQVGLLWLTAVAFGIAYGGAVIVEETKETHIKKEELEKLHLSIGINHSMIEDPALFLSLGLSAFWLWVPRFILAIVAVRLLDIYYKLKVIYKPKLSISNCDRKL
ncbi:MAG: nucleoside recognition domain-containing protein [Deltaproteobacteria bacterium]|jgi:Fe2+ transport system protein B|nr:nucleoside recognition domain-containing protein [Deltaproteobacteria bacterium]